MSKLRGYMQRNFLTLEQAEQGLRWEAELCLGVWHYAKGFPDDIPWTKAELGTFAPYGAFKIEDTGDGEEAIPFDEEILMQEENRRDWAKIRKRTSKKGKDKGSEEVKDVRILWSWLLDELGGNAGKVRRGEKLRVILGKCLNYETRRKRIPQLEQDGETILGALEMLRKDPLKVRRTWKRSRSPAVQLAALSLEMQDQQEEKKLTRQEELGKKLRKAQAKLAEAEAEVRRAQAKLRRAQEKFAKEAEEVRLIELELGHLNGELGPGKTGK